jgi:DNA replicative helicase MCM subunit Mcm2 (Cdc46/Mcm family)
MVEQINQNLKEKQKPFSLRKNEIIRTFFREVRKTDKGEYYLNGPKYVESLRHQVTYQNKSYPLVEIILAEIMFFDEELLNYILKEPEKAILDIEKSFLEETKQHADFAKFLTNPRCMFKQIHITFDIAGVESLIPIYEHFTEGTRIYKGILLRIRALFSSLFLDRETIASIIEFECYNGHRTQRQQHRTIHGKYKFPSFCIDNKGKKPCNAKAKRDFRIIQNLGEFHRGYFKIHERDATQLELDCYAFLNYDYFSEKVKNLNINDEIEIIGIIKNDYSELESSKDNQQIREYIEVIDFHAIYLKKTDPDIVKNLYEKFKENKNYHHLILDSIHPFSRGFYEFFIMKLIILLGIGTADSWDATIEKRNSNNAIIGSAGGQLKGSILRAFQEIMGINQCGIISGQDTTRAGLIPTSQRGNEKEALILRYGALAFFNRWLLGIDEAQYMIRKKDVFSKTKYLEDGFIDRAMDGSLVNSECKLSLLLLMNYSFSKNEEEEYDYDLTLAGNLKYISSSELQRFDIHYAIPTMPELFVKILEHRVFDKAYNPIDQNVIFNYVMEYRKIIKEGVKFDKIQQQIEAYIEDLRSNREGRRSTNIREFRILLKMIAGVAAMRLKKEADLDDLEYIKKHLVNYMIPFFDSDKIRHMRTISVKEIYQRVVSLLSEIKPILPVSLIIEILQQQLKAFYFPRLIENRIAKPVPEGQVDIWKMLCTPLKDKELTEEYHKYIGDALNLQNTQFRKEYEDPENIQFIESLGFIRAKIDNKSALIKKAWLTDVVRNRIIESFKAAKYKPLERSSLMQVLDLEYSYDVDTINLMIDEIIKEGTLYQTENNYLEIKS